MRDKKMFLSTILITAAMLFAGGCGKQAEPVSAEWVETVKEADTEEESEQDLEYEIISMDDTVMYATSNCDIRSGAGTQYDTVGSLSYAQEVTINGKVEADEDKLWYVIKTEDGSIQMVSASMLSETKPAAQTSSGNGSGSGSNSGGSTKDTGNSENASASNETVHTEQPVSTPEPVHEHTWKEHTATKQVWVPNIVIVDDYEYQVVGHVDSVSICNCGFTTTDRDTIVEHIKNHGFAGENTSII